MAATAALRLVLGVVALAAVLTAAADADSCTFQPNCDFAKGTREHDAATSQEQCCSLCASRPGCAAGVFDGHDCWYKTEAQVKSGCHKSSVVGACMPKSIKPGPPPPPTPSPPPPPSPTPTPSPGPPPSPGPQPIVPPSAPPPCPSGAKPVKVFILMGQSNMLGEGKKMGTTNGTLEFAVKTEGKYPYLWDKKSSNWTQSKNVRNVFVMGSGGVDAGITLFHNEFMTAAITTPPNVPGMSSKSKTTIGPELGIGFTVGQYLNSDEVMTLKSCIGDRALGWDLLPPGSPGYNCTEGKQNETYTYAAYHQSPSKWPVGTTPTPIGWYAGLQYDGDTQRAYNVLGNMTNTFYPGSKCYEVAGFFWWQGDRDSRDICLSEHYEENLVRLINQLRTQYGSPKAKFVCASLGQTVKGDTGGGGLILDAMLNVANATKYPQFKGNVAAVYSHPYSMGSSSGAHYGGNAETYMNIGQAMGEAMVKLLQEDEH